MSDEPFTLKEALFKPGMVKAFSEAIQRVYPPLDGEGFLGRIFAGGWEELALMDRMRHITSVLHDFLPAGYRNALAVLHEALPHLPREGFIGMVPPDFVATYGLDDPDASIPALEAFTILASAEFAVRPFITRYPERMMAQMLAWAEHEHPGVRRLASEGCRPRLPWGMRLHALVEDPSPILPILEKLKHDESESVRRSVANNLNDISKDNPEVVLEVLGSWKAEEGDSGEIQWITSHALRTLIKAGAAEALELLGYPADPQIVLRQVRLEPSEIAMGESVVLSYEIESTSNKTQRLMIDYVVYHMRANGEQTPKVFKHKKIRIDPGEVVQIKRKHGFRPVTTRRYYPGRQAIQPQINGRSFERIEFVLMD